MKCMDCVEKGGVFFSAQWILLGDSSNDYQVRLVCETCLHEYIHGYGEEDLVYFRIDDERALTTLVVEVNHTLKYLSEMYSRVLKERSTLKKQIQSLATKVIE